METMDASIMRFATGKGPKDSGVDAEDDSFLSRNCYPLSIDALQTFASV